MKCGLKLLLGVVALAAGSFVSAAVPQGEPALDWSSLPPLPQGSGRVGTFAGMSRGTLIVAGGVSLPAGSPGDSANQVWHDRIFLLDLETPGLADGDKPARAVWRESKQRLPRPLAYGLSLTTAEGLLCIGGGDQQRYYRDVFLLRMRDGEVERIDLPPTPRAVAFACGAVVGNTVYVAGGREAPEAPRALKTFWVNDLAELGKQQRPWREWEPWPGHPRMSAVAAAQAGSFFLFSGIDLVAGNDGAIRREYLTDSYRFTPGQGWRRLAALPRPATGAPSPAPCLGQTHVAVIGGDDGSRAGQGSAPDKQQAGFHREVLAYETITDTWVAMGRISACDGAQPPLASVAVPWDADFIFPGGEERPGVQSAQVLLARRHRVEATFSWLDYLAVAAYLGTLVAMGFYFSRRENTTDDFFLGGRRIPWWAAGLSIFGTQLSAITFMAIPAKAFATDWVYLMGHVAVVAVTPLLVWAYLPFYRRLNVTTAYEYLEKRFNLGARLLGSASFILLQLGRMGVVLYLPAMALSAVTGVDVYLCILAMGLLATLYTVLGGIEAVVWTDVIQVVVLLGGALLSLGVILGGLEGGASQVVAMGREAGKFRMINPTWDIATTAIWVILVGKMLEGLVPYTADQTVVQRYLTTRDEKQAARSIWSNALLIVPSGALFFSLGTALWAFYKSHPAWLVPLDETDRILPWFVAQQLPPGISGLVIAALFAAAMSSLDSSMNSIATALTTDWYRRFRPGASDEHCLRLARWFTVALGAVGTGLAIYMAVIGSRSLWDQYLRIVGLFGGGVAGLFLVGIFTRRANGSGAVAGFFTSAVVIYFVRASGAIHFFLYAAIGIVTCAGVTWLVSHWTPGRKDVEGLTIHTLPAED